MTPHFLFVLSTGDIWVGIDPNVVPAGTILATYRISGLAALQKIGTVSGNSGSYACSGGLTTSKHDASKEIK
jgi:hypothetical protein